jgi:hypothetical protein
MNNSTKTVQNYLEKYSNLLAGENGPKPAPALPDRLIQSLQNPIFTAKPSIGQQSQLFRNESIEKSLKVAARKSKEDRDPGKEQIAADYTLQASIFKLKSQGLKKSKRHAKKCGTQRSKSFLRNTRKIASGEALEKFSFSSFFGARGLKSKKNEAGGDAEDNQALKKGNKTFSMRNLKGKRVKSSMGQRIKQKIFQSYAGSGSSTSKQTE